MLTIKMLFSRLLSIKWESKEKGKEKGKEMNIFRGIIVEIRVVRGMRQRGV